MEGSTPLTEEDYDTVRRCGRCFTSSGIRVRPAPAAEVRLRERTGCGGGPCRQTNTNLTALTESLLIPLNLLNLLNLPVPNPADESVHL